MNPTHSIQDLPSIVDRDENNESKPAKRSVSIQEDNSDVTRKPSTKSHSFTRKNSVPLGKADASRRVSLLPLKKIDGYGSQATITRRNSLTKRTPMVRRSSTSALTNDQNYRNSALRRYSVASLPTAGIQQEKAPKFRRTSTAYNGFPNSKGRKISKGNPSRKPSLKYPQSKQMKKHLVKKKELGQDKATEEIEELITEDVKKVDEKKKKVIAIPRRKKKTN